MKLIIAGSRELIVTVNEIADIIAKHNIKDITEIVSGCARGPDTVAIEYAHANNIPTKRFYAEWTKQGKAAGIIRNRLMGKYGDQLLAFWDGRSRGTWDMCKFMGKLGKTKYVIMKGVTYKQPRPRMCDLDQSNPCEEPCCRGKNNENC